ncbi:MAG: hypothetical protein ACR2N3_07780 [Pyrinomonadaceae bacterium]
MSTNLQKVIQEQARVLSENELREVLNFMQNLRKKKIAKQAKSISSIFEELSGEIPLEEWQDLPPDGAENHDHYLYGAPKKTK